MEITYSMLPKYGHAFLCFMRNVTLICDEMKTVNKMLKFKKNNCENNTLLEVYYSIMW